MALEDRARGLRWIRRARAQVDHQTVEVTRGAGWTQPALFVCAEDGTEVPDDRAARFRKARRVLEDVERRVGVKPPAKRPPDRPQDSATG
jgi:hypothetical protein